MNDNPLEETLAYFMELEDIQRRQAMAHSDMTTDLLASAHSVAETKVDELCSAPVVRDALVSFLSSVDGAIADLDFLRKSQSAVELQPQIDALDAEVQTRQSDPTYRLAKKFLGKVGLIDEMYGEQPEPSKEALQVDFLSRPPAEVAANLAGKTITYGRSKLIVEDVRVQNREDNAKYLKSKPLFGADRRDVYVAAFRGATMLFLRAGDENNTDCCVAIMGGTIRGEKLTKPTHVAKALNLPAESVGNFVASEDGQQFKVSDIEPRQKKR